MFTLKTPITIAADDIFVMHIFFFFSNKMSLDISCESSAWQTIHMKCQDSFSLKNNEKRKLICRLQQILLGALSVNCSYVKKLTFLAESAPAQKTDNANMQVYIIPGTRPEKTSLSHMYSYTRATMWEDIPSNIFAQRRLKSACACAQSDQNLRCPHEETLHLWLLEMHTVKTMIKLRESQADLNLRWAHMLWGTFSNVVAHKMCWHLKLYSLKIWTDQFDWLAICLKRCWWTANTVDQHNTAP